MSLWRWNTPCLGTIVPPSLTGGEPSDCVFELFYCSFNCRLDSWTTSSFCAGPFLFDAAENRLSLCWALNDETFSPFCYGVQLD